jgi:hypothetical protein
VKSQEVIDRLRALRDEAATLPSSVESAEFNSWKPRTRSALTRALGEQHHITQKFIKIKWTPTAYMLDDTTVFARTFVATIPVAQGVLNAAVAEMELLAEEGLAANESDIDSEPQ